MLSYFGVRVCLVDSEQVYQSSSMSNRYYHIFIFFIKFFEIAICWIAGGIQRIFSQNVADGDVKETLSGESVLI